MHRSSFRARKASTTVETPVARERAQPDRELGAIREQIENLCEQIHPIHANLEALSKPKDDITIPGDVAKSLQLVHGRLDRLERQQKAADEQAERAISTFSNAILKLGDKIEKISGGEDSKFSLAHSLEKLLAVLCARKLRIVRDSNGDMVSVETEVGADGRYH